MARIESLGEFFHFTNSRGRAVDKKGRARSGAFRELVEESVERAAETEGSTAAADESGTLDELLDQVHSTGDALKKRQSEAAIHAYRSAVQAFLRYALRKTYRTERHRSRPNPRKGTQKTYLLVRIVDAKLERLVVDVLSSQVDQLELLKRIEEINGLLVDLVS